MDAKKTGQFIREQRKKLGYSQQQLSELLYVEYQTISKWERGLGMPDYSNIEKLKEIFGCDLSDILEPKGDEISEPCDQEVELQEWASLPFATEFLQEQQDEEHQKKQPFSLKGIFSLLNKNKTKQQIGQAFGSEYETLYAKKFLFKRLFKKRGKQDYEATLTQGMFSDHASRTVLGTQAPWLWVRIFLAMLLCSVLGIVCMTVTYNPIFATLSCAALVAIPFVVFLFECNFERNVSIIDITKLFFLGGIFSILLTMLYTSIQGNALTLALGLTEAFFLLDNLTLLALSEEFTRQVVLTRVVLEPLLDGIVIALVTIFFLSKIKPKRVLTGMLVGCAVGAGFEVFRFFNTVIDAFGGSFSLAIISSFLGEFPSELDGFVTKAIFDEVFGGVFMGPHFFAAIFGACYVLFKKDLRFRLRDLFQWRVTLSLLFSIALHMLENATDIADNVFLELLAGLLCWGATLLFFHAGIAQAKLTQIYESVQAEHAKESKPESVSTQ